MNILENSFNRMESEENKIGKLIKDVCLIDVVKRYVFFSQIPNSVRNFFDSVTKFIHQRTFGSAIDCKINDFGSVTKNFILDEPKKIFVDNAQNKTKFLNSTPLFRIYQSIPQKIFWNNVAYIHCYSRDSFNKVRNAIGEYSSSRDNLMTRVKTINTGLQTSTLAYILEPNDDKTTTFNIEDRNGKKIFDENKIVDINDVMDILKQMNVTNIKSEKNEIQTLLNNINQNQVETSMSNNKENWINEYNNYISSMNRIYIIIVSEGLFNKYDFLKKAGNFFNKITGKRIDNSSAIQNAQRKMSGYK